MQMITWVILPVLCVIAVAVYLYRKVKAAVKCFLPAYSFLEKEQLQRLFLYAVDYSRGQNLWHLVYNPASFYCIFTVAGCSCFSYKKIEKAKSVSTESLFPCLAGSPLWPVCAGTGSYMTESILALPIRSRFWYSSTIETRFCFVSVTEDNNLLFLLKFRHDLTDHGCSKFQL